MTKEDLRKIDELLPASDLIGFAGRMADKFHFEPEKLFPQTVDSEVMPSAARRQMYVDKTLKLLRRAICLGGTIADIGKICEYLIVLVKSTDLKLDYKRASSELEIDYLEQKYGYGEFYTTDIPFDEIGRWIDQDGGYEVTIKDDK